MAFPQRLKGRTVKKLDKLARSQVMNRTEFLACLMQDAIERGFTPLCGGEGYRVVTTTGKVTSVEKRWIIC